MSRRILRYTSGWEWHIPQQTTPSESIQQCPEAANWIFQVYDKTSNGILISQSEDGIFVQGSVQIQLSEDTDDISDFHFWLTSKKLITMTSDNRIPLRLQNPNHLTAYENCQTAPEAFCSMMNILLEYLHIGLDKFQNRLGKLEKRVSEQNRKDLLDEIIERRYELLHYNHLYLPYREFEGILKEAFLDELTETASFKRFRHRFERLETLLKHYALEIDTLLSVDDAISSMRGNDIIRTLTIFTVICLPASILGAIWGSNFQWLPFKHDPLGFIYMVIAIFIITSVIYYFLWKKGWTGDIMSYKRSSQINEKPSSSDYTLQVTEVTKEEVSALPSRKARKRHALKEMNHKDEHISSEGLSRSRKKRS